MNRGLSSAQLIALAFATAILVGTILLWLPIATEGPGGSSFLTAAFTSTSAVCVTGLIVVDTPTYYSTFGETVIMGLVQIGGLGIMTLTSLLALLVVRRLGLRSRLIAQAESGTLQLGDVRRVILGVVVLSFVFELLTAIVLAVRLAVSYDYGAGRAIYHGIFHSVTAFNNAGFVLYTDNLIPFAADGWIVVAISVAIIAGGLGFPVWLEMRSLPRGPRRWSLHTRLTLAVTAALLGGGFVAFLGFEWSNNETIGKLGLGGKLLTSFFGSVTPRTAGFNTVDYAEVVPETLLVTDLLMFIGTGSAATGGGIKVTTVAVLALMVYAEMRGDTTVNAFGRRVPAVAQRQAFTVAFLALAAVVVCTLVLEAVSPFDLEATLFEALSAFGTVGLSTGITADLPASGKVALIVLMFLGRVGPHVVGAALVLRERERLFRNPEERPIIG
ncbi:MAG TPA: potassium transporter TrkG [Gaiellaceae bacterium]|jgi:potassium uptake TrkH family protein|nr:potassium transporter TrkG [Gaiellaceae bacterium]